MCPGDKCPTFVKYHENTFIDQGGGCGIYNETSKGYRNEGKVEESLEYTLTSSVHILKQIKS